MLSPISRISAALILTVTSAVAPAEPAQAALPGAQVTSGTSASDSQPAKPAVAFCPEGKRVTGGGVRVIGPAHVLVTRMQPIHSNNRDRFEVSAAEDEIGTGGNWSVQAFAVCADPLPQQEIITITVSGDGLPSQSAGARCPSGKRALGGGGRITGGQGQVHLSAVRHAPTLTLAAGQVDGTGFAEAWTVTAYVVCAVIDPARLRFPEFAGLVDSLSPKVQSVDCTVTGFRVTGGGFNITAPGVAGDVVIQAVVPQVSIGDVPGAQVQVIARENNPTNGDWRVSAGAACAV